MKKDLLTLDDLKKNEILKILELTKKLKKKPIGNQLKGKIFCLFFEKPSTRTRISFATGIQQLGGGIVYLDKTKSQLSRGETLQDTARVLDRYADAVIARVYLHKTLEIMSECMNAHVINALSDLTHPCQILSDLFTIQERFGYLKGLKLAYVGDGNNVCNSLLLGCTKMGMDISVACPKGYEPNRKIIQLAKRYSKVSKSRIKIERDPKNAVKNADIIYNDTFVSMGEEKERKKRLKIFLPKYQVNSKLLKYAQPDVIYMHCLPAHRGEEVTDEVIDGPHSIVFDQAENRLHTQKALLSLMVGRRILI